MARQQLPPPLGISFHKEPFNREPENLRCGARGSRTFSGSRLPVQWIGVGAGSEGASDDLPIPIPIDFTGSGRALKFPRAPISVAFAATV